VLTGRFQSTRARQAKRAATALGVAVCVLLPTSGAEATTLTVRVHLAQFNGPYAGPGRKSTTTTCNEIVTNGPGTGLFPCAVDFTITKGVNICAINAGDAAGIANYWSHFPEFDVKEIHLSGADSRGTGQLVGTAIIVGGTPSLLTIRISFASLCDSDEPTKVFAGDTHLL
jgi:hypothetical protein